MIDDLKETIERGKAEIGILITLEEPTRDYPRIQILTIRELLEEHKKPTLPLLILPTYQQAERIAYHIKADEDHGPA